MFQCDKNILDIDNVVYQIQNNINGKRYVGKTEKSLRFRLKTHLKHIRNKTNRCFYDAVRKYGAHNFIVSILKQCNNKEELNESEIYFIKNYNTISREFGYNMTIGGDGGAHSPEIMQRIADMKRGVPLSPEHREKISSALRGHPSHMSKETAKKISITLKERKICPPTNPMLGKFGECHNRFGKKHTEESKKKMSDSHKGKLRNLTDTERLVLKQNFMGNKNPNYIEIKKEELAFYILDNLQPKEIAIIYGVSRQTIHNKFKSFWGVSSIKKLRIILQ